MFEGLEAYPAHWPQSWGAGDPGGWACWGKSARTPGVCSSSGRKPSPAAPRTALHSPPETRPGSPKPKQASGATHNKPKLVSGATHNKYSPKPKQASGATHNKDSPKPKQALGACGTPPLGRCSTGLESPPRRMRARRGQVLNGEYYPFHLLCRSAPWPAARHWGQTAASSWVQHHGQRRSGE